MNPLLFKAHPLLYLTVDLVVNPSAHTLEDFSMLALVYLTVNLVWAGCLMIAVKRTAGFVPAYGVAYLLALPSLLFFLPLMLTLLSDVLAHAFRFDDRYILIFALFIAVQMVGAGYGGLIKYPRNDRPIGLKAGCVVSLTLLLFSLPFGLMLLILDEVVDVF